MERQEPGSGVFEELGQGVTCIDAGYVAPGMACFYLLESGGEYALIETGTQHSAANLRAVMRRRGIEAAQVRYVIPTHVHLDHAGGAGALMAQMPDAQLLIHPRGARHMADPEKLVAASIAVYGEDVFRELYGDIRAVDPGRIRAMEDGESVSLGGRRLEFRHTEGHARHHFCIWDETSRGWFSGDMFGLCYRWCRFDGGNFVLPSTTPTQFDPGAFLASLDLLQAYRPGRVYLTHYGAVDYTETAARLLARQVRDYCDIAARVDGGALEAALADYTLDLLRPYAPDEPETALRQRLQFDMQLNAMGLAHWRGQAA